MTITPVTLTNPGAETGDLTGWTVRSGTSPISNTTDAQGFNGPHSGTRLFCLPDHVTDGSMDQEWTIDAGFLAAVDAGVASAAAKAWFKGDGLFDYGALYLQALDSSHAQLDYWESGHNRPTTYTQIEVDGTLPVNTRYLRIGVRFVREAGPTCNAIVDDFTLDFNDGSAISISLYQLGTYTLSTFPTAQIRGSQLGTYVLASSETSTGLFKVKVHQLGVYVLTRPSPRRRRMQAWTFSLDGHDFYVLDLAGEGTVVYDLITGQWAEWRTKDRITWRARIGCNWLGMAKTTVDRLYGTNIVCGDDIEGVLWVLDPQQGFDDAVDVDGEDQPFTRYVTGYLPMRMRQTQSCAGVYVTLSLGSPTITGAAMTLRTSDDNGHTYYDHGSVTITPSGYDQEIAWRGLGLMKSPGRLFELTDTGAAVRVAAADMKDPS